MSFSATIFKVGVNLCVDVPARISKELARRGYVPVNVKVNGFTARATLVPIGQGRHRLFIKGEMRKGAGVDVGNRTHITLEIDRKSRRLPYAPDLMRALRSVPAHWKAFQRLPRSHRKDLAAKLRRQERKRIGSGETGPPHRSL